MWQAAVSSSIDTLTIAHLTCSPVAADGTQRIKDGPNGQTYRWEGCTLANRLSTVNPVWNTVEIADCYAKLAAGR